MTPKILKTTAKTAAYYEGDLEIDTIPWCEITELHDFTESYFGLYIAVKV